MGQKLNKKSFVIQGSILAIAGILVRVIGLVYRIPLTRIIGNEGMGYYSTAFDIYNLLILLSSQSMPLAVSKIVSEKLGKHQFKNAHKVFKGAMYYALILGVIVGVVAFFGADWIATNIYKSAPAGRALRILAPTLTVVCVLGVMRGYFQGMGNMIPTAVSQVFEQIVNAVVSIIAAYELSVYGLSIAHAANMSENNAATLQHSWGAAGGTLGTLMGAITALLVVALVYYYNRNIINRHVKKDKSYQIDSYSTITKIIVFTITPVLISTTIYNVSNLIDNPIYNNIMSSVFKMSEPARAVMWGIYSGKYRVLTTMPIAIASALSTAIVPSLVKSYISKNTRDVKNKVSLALKFSMIIAFPCGVGLSVLGGPINQLLFNEPAKETTVIMIFSVFTVIAFSLSTISNAILQGIDKLKTPIKNSAIALALHLVIVPIFLLVFRMGIYGVVVGDITFGATVSILNAYSIKHYLGYEQEFKNTFFKPLMCAVAMGIGGFAIYHLIMKGIGWNSLSVFVAILISAGIYCVMLIVTKTITENELYSLPKGGVIVRIFKKIKLI